MYEFKLWINVTQSVKNLNLKRGDIQTSEEVVFNTSEEVVIQNPEGVINNTTEVA